MVLEVREQHRLAVGVGDSPSAHAGIADIDAWFVVVLLLNVSGVSGSVGLAAPRPARARTRAAKRIFVGVNKCRRRQGKNERCEREETPRSARSVPLAPAGVFRGFHRVHVDRRTLL